MCPPPVPPKIAPFAAGERVVAGERLTLTCTVSRGDEPLSLTWLWDGSPLSPGGAHTGGLSVVNLNTFNSVLSIERVGQHHAGDYTCVAANAAAATRYTYTLTVHGTPPTPGTPLTPPPPSPSSFICVMTKFLTFVFLSSPILQFPLVLNLFRSKRVYRKACELV